MTSVSSEPTPQQDLIFGIPRSKWYGTLGATFLIFGTSAQTELAPNVYSDPSLLTIIWVLLNVCAGWFAYADMSWMDPTPENPTERILARAFYSAIFTRFFFHLVRYTEYFGLLGAILVSLAFFSLCFELSKRLDNDTVEDDPRARETSPVRWR